MQPRHRRLLLVAVLGAIAQFHPAATLRRPKKRWPELSPLSCTGRALLVLSRETLCKTETIRHPSRPCGPCRCDEAFYRVTLVPHVGARITPLFQEDKCRTTIAK